MRDVGVAGVETCPLPVAADGVGTGPPLPAMVRRIRPTRTPARPLLAHQDQGDRVRGLYRGLTDEDDEGWVVYDPIDEVPNLFLRDRKSTRLNSSHANISYAVFCLKKKN